MRKRAFTLIELLVVIAIIAILAAILFPVFAQAKQAAKKASSISNDKQNALAIIMYAADYDDLAVITVNWGGQGNPATVGGVRYSPWTWLILPYMKNGGVLHDPQAPPMEPFPVTVPPWPPLTAQVLVPQYGYNYTVWCPLTGPAPSPNATQAAISMTSVGAPADTPLLVNKFSTAEDILGPTSFYWYGPGSVPTVLITDPPDCNTIPPWCFGNWGMGNGTFWDSTAYNYLNRSIPAGARTAANSRRQGDNMVVAWGDGHVSAKPPGAMSAGTNWTPTLDASTLTVLDRSKYLWDNQ
jgi:prepilin-type N-terminal cleavage/methylation domain-containing protein